MKKITLSIVLLFCVFSVEVLNGQSLLEKIPLRDQIQMSELVVEGEVISKKSFWDSDYGNIYTANTVRVYKVFKGQEVTTIDVITLGGVVGQQALVVTPELNLEMGDIGVFTLKKSIVDHGNISRKSINKEFRALASVQSFYEYNVYSNAVVNPFKKVKGINTTFYNEIKNITKADYKEINQSAVLNRVSGKTAKGLLVPTGITFSPTTVTAGTKTVLTISGTDFGATQGNVGFSNADDGGGTFTSALDSQVLTWSDTEITVEVPATAGTGPIRVQDSATDIGQSAASLIVTYAEINIPFDPDDATGQDPPGVNGPLGFYAYPTRHINENTSGGYTWEMQTDFFNDSEFPGAKAAFEMALDKWRCETNVNWDISSSATTTDVAIADGVNVIKFDNNAVPADDLPDGVLGQCSSWYSGCGTFGDAASWDWHVTELDIVFDDETDWFFGAGLPGLIEYDFESVALHELGHGHQLAHVIDPTSDGDNLDDVMHYAISNSEQQRVFSAGNVSGATHVHVRSTSEIACSQTVMTDSSICNLSIDEKELEEAITIYPNPARGEFQIKNVSFIDLEKAVIYDLSGRLISTRDLTNGPRTKTIDITDVSSGIYFINIHSERAMISKKILVE